MPPTEEEVLQALRSVNDPDLRKDIVSLGFVKDLSISGDRVQFKIELTTPACPVKDLLQEEARGVVAALPGVKTVEVEMTAQVRTSVEKGEVLPEVRNVIAVASGKGGVGKSTVSVNLAVSLAKTGATVGLLDADVYGPSIPLMMGAEHDKPWSKAGRILPIEKFGIKMMSLGFLLEEGQAVIWRGPMVGTTVSQLLRDVDWGALDYLIVDLPPGTGDASLSLAQTAPITGVVIVATPHDVAANIAGKAVTLFEKLNVPLLGVVENMSSFACPSCGTTTRIFAGMSGEELAASYKVPFLGSVPLDPEVSDSGDKGTPSVIAHPQSAHSEAFRAIAGRLAAEVSKSAYAEKGLVRKLGAV
ncbi:MAG: Iron-sulfur cluster carrier protein [Fimbriimonadales bacterium]|nr:Iron-sulfur cluster carrier protein [Fimbriimonadales bacterium]